MQLELNVDRVVPLGVALTLMGPVVMPATIHAQCPPGINVLVALGQDTVSLEAFFPHTVRVRAGEAAQTARSHAGPADTTFWFVQAGHMQDQVNNSASIGDQE